MYLRLFRSIVAAVATIHDRSVLHLDLKVDNVLLRHKGLGRTSGQAAFDAAVAIGDFGEAVHRPGVAPHDVFTLQSRGTEAVRAKRWSPLSAAPSCLLPLSAAFACTTLICNGVRTAHGIS